MVPECKLHGTSPSGLGTLYPLFEKGGLGSVVQADTGVVLHGCGYAEPRRPPGAPVGCILFQVVWGGNCMASGSPADGL